MATFTEITGRVTATFKDQNKGTCNTTLHLAPNHAAFVANAGKLGFNAVGVFDKMEAASGSVISNLSAQIRAVSDTTNPFASIGSEPRPGQKAVCLLETALLQRVKLSVPSYRVLLTPGKTVIARGTALADANADFKDFVDWLLATNGGAGTKSGTKVKQLLTAYLFHNASGKILRLVRG